MADPMYSTLHDPYVVLSGPTAQALLGLDHNGEPAGPASDGVSERLQDLVRNADDVYSLPREIVSIGTVALNVFLQATVTGPPLGWNLAKLIPAHALLSRSKASEQDDLSRLTGCLSTDGEAVYERIPNVELFSFAKIILNAPGLERAGELPRARLRVNTWHQRLLNQPSPTLEQSIYNDLQAIEWALPSRSPETETEYAAFLLERATIHILHGFDDRARADLRGAARARSFEFVLTGKLGKRTKFQQKDISQLVVLAKSADQQKYASEKTYNDATRKSPISTFKDDTQPQALRLEDDTLLESISFNKPGDASEGGDNDDSLPGSLASLDPGNQPLLDPLDAIILLATASSITNTSPADGMTREETAPYAERVISGGSSNFQVYTQALLVRSRIEGYRTRTIERGVLQLQAVVDQVIAETTVPASDSSRGVNDEGTSTFLPRPKHSESASAVERLKYIHQLASPPRWKLEAELADRWVSLGGLTTALEIYDRLQMWAEAALCWAANDREDKARTIVRRQLYISSKAEVLKKTIGDNDEFKVEDLTIERDPLPANAPRLFCILGDLEASPSAYERAWEVSQQRFARAQRSLGKYYMTKNDLSSADKAYAKSLKVNPQNHATWFALGCVRIQTEDWPGAVDAFGRAVQIEDSDAESWSNLAVSLLRMPNDHDGQENHVRGAFIAMKRATSLKRDNTKLWQNLLAIAIKLSPPPYSEIVMAQSRLIELLGRSQGESAVDVPVVEALLAHVFEGDGPVADDPDAPPPSKGLKKLVVDLINKQILPLVTSSRPLWLLIAKLNIHLKRPLAALNTYEKAWRSALNQPGWESVKKQWQDISDATIELIDAYESLGERNRESGLGEGELVCKDWKFKARSAARSVLARAKETWEGNEAYELLNERLQDLKST